MTVSAPSRRGRRSRLHRTQAVTAAAAADAATRRLVQLLLLSGGGGSLTLSLPPLPPRASSARLAQQLWRAAGVQC